MNKDQSSSRAFVLLYSLLVASIVLSIGMSLATIISKQIMLSSIGKMSRVAYYAADSGRGCAYFWAVKYFNTVTNAFGTPPISVYCQSGPVSPAPAPNSAEETIDKNLLQIYGINLTGVYSHYYFIQEIDVGSGQKACNKVSIFLNDTAYKSVIVSRGFSAACGVTNSRTVGRSVVNYIEK